MALTASKTALAEMASIRVATLELSAMLAMPDVGEVAPFVANVAYKFQSVTASAKTCGAAALIASAKVGLKPRLSPVALFVIWGICWIF